MLPASQVRSRFGPSVTVVSRQPVDADLSDADTSAVRAKTEATLDIHRKGTMDQRRQALTRLLDEPTLVPAQYTERRSA